MDPAPRLATRADFDEIVGSLPRFWGDRDVSHIHHPTAIEEFGDSALVVEDAPGSVAAYLFGMIVTARRRGYVHAVAVRDDHRRGGHARRLYDAFAGLATARGCTELKAITSTRNADAIAFHESIGMRGRAVADYSGPGIDRIVFTRPLASREHPPPPDPALGLRAATAADVPAILAFWRVAAHDDDRPADRSDAVAALIARDPGALLLAIDGGAIVGSVIAGWDGWRAHLYRLAVDPGHRRRGIGRWLLAAAERQLAADGAGRLDAMVIDDNDGGRAVWSAAGYRPQDNWSRWVKPVARPAPPGR